MKKINNQEQYNTALGLLEELLNKLSVLTTEEEELLDELSDAIEEWEDENMNLDFNVFENEN